MIGGISDHSRFIDKINLGSESLEFVCMSDVTESKMYRR